LTGTLVEKSVGRFGNSKLSPSHDDTPGLPDSSPQVRINFIKDESFAGAAGKFRLCVNEVT
jgi:hypothetical protein